MNREPCYQANDVEVLPDRRIAISWEDGRQSFFHFVWLRQQHFHPAFGRPDLGENDVRLPDDPKALSVRGCRIADYHLIVDWANDGVQTRHEIGWLHDNAYDRDLRQARKFKPHTWIWEDASTSAWFEWNEVFEDESRLWKLYTTMRDYGFARVRTAPVEAGAIVALAEKFGPIRATDFGSVFDNHRVLHARTAFEPDAGPRRIQQCAVDREEFHNRLRILANKLGYTADAKMILPTGALG